MSHLRLVHAEEPGPRPFVRDVCADRLVELAVDGARTGDDVQLRGALSTALCLYQPQTAAELVFRRALGQLTGVAHRRARRALRRYERSSDVA